MYIDRTVKTWQVQYRFINYCVEEGRRPTSLLLVDPVMYSILPFYLLIQRNQNNNQGEEGQTQKVVVLKNHVNIKKESIKVVSTYSVLSSLNSDLLSMSKSLYR